MTTGVTRWTGREVALLREALRMIGKDFSAKVGISTRQLVNWEGRGESIKPHPNNQAALDTLLSTSSPDAQWRFAQLLTEQAAVGHDERTEELLRRDPRTIRHLVDGKVMVLIEEGIYPTTNLDYEQFIRATGHRPPQHWTGRRCPSALYDHPVVWVTWHDADAYARWAGKALPTASLLLGKKERASTRQPGCVAESVSPQPRSGRRDGPPRERGRCRPAERRHGPIASRVRAPDQGNSEGEKSVKGGNWRGN
ncbi:SUMF1/EgtB/PvdO family nonheme iron enzyme [Streptomyces phaeolivaceus]|uniref:SUMF1/EgtB/PvdO family nonheme iron enzyme n=1 Tax=Streptomyces phaeolivaceus TaxID=2653200 RepID=UPI001D037068|nr:SUMF1/EgtB/PvdO family nonheme iron enzyme [Streptomyces phaeolivaceus]